MFPTEQLTSTNMNALLFYIAILGLLLLIGVIIRVKVTFFKKYFISAALIAGALGLALGQYGLGVLPAEMTQSWGALPGVLITVVFAPMLMGIALPNPKKMGKLLAPQLLFGYIGEGFIIAMPFILTALLFMPVWGVNSMFGSIVEIGWPGGHGTAGGMVDVYTSLGWADGGDLALTSATIGLLVGIIGGMIIINYGVRKGYTSVLKSVDDIRADKSPDLLPKSEQPSSSATTVNKDVVESFAFHAALISIAILIGWVIQQGLAVWVEGIPLFPLAMIGGLFVQLIISKTKWNEAVDVRTFQRIQGLALEFLIIGAIASISIPVVIAYAVPFAIMMVLTTVLMVWFFFWAGPRLFREDWFEHSIVNYGSLTGVVAVGLMLLRTADPEMKTDAGRIYALRAPFISPVIGGGLVSSSLPFLAITYGPLTVGLVALAMTVVLIFLAKIGGFWVKPSTKQMSQSI